MRNWIIGAAAIVAAAVPGVAAAQTGYVDVGYASSSLEQSGFDQDVDTWAAGGAVAFDAGGLGIQLDGRFGNAEPDSGGDVDFYSIGGHLYSRQGDWLFGGYVGLGNIESSGTDLDEWTVAAETQYYMANTTLSGALSYSEAEDANIETTAVDLGVRHFLNDNLALDASLGFGSLETSGSDADVMSFGIGGEYQFASMPVSVFGGYLRSEVEDADIEVDSVSVGIRYNWGGTLRDRDRSGAGLGRRQGSYSRLLGGIV